MHGAALGAGVITWPVTVLDLSGSFAAGPLIVPVSKGLPHVVSLCCVCGPLMVVHGLAMCQAGIKVVCTALTCQHWFHLHVKHVLEVVEVLHELIRTVPRETRQTIYGTELSCVVHGVEDEQWSLDIIIHVLQKVHVTHALYMYSYSQVQTCNSTCWDQSA